MAKNTDPKAVSKADGQSKYISGVNQPRDIKGKFRTVLARIKQDLGASGLQDVVEKVQEAENLDNAGNYDDAVKAANDLKGLLDRLDSGTLDATALENVRASARALGQVLSNLPLPFGQDAQKVRFSDLPPVLKNLIEDMVTRVEEKIGKEDADPATQSIRNFKAGGDYYSQSDVSSQMSKLLRLLT
jgi:hypothetical protein